MDACKEITDACTEMVDSCKAMEVSCRDLADSYKSLEAMAADLLSSWELFKVQQAAATSSPSTTTTQPPTAPVPAPPTPKEALANIELVMDRPLKLSVVPKLVVPVPAMCSTKCRDVLAKQCEATSSALAGTVVFTPVQDAAVLQATTQPSTLVDVHKRCSHTNRPGVPLTAIMVSSVRVPPRPPDRRCRSKEQGASLPPSVSLSASRKEPGCSWLRPVPTRPPDQCKPGLLPVLSRPPEQTHGTVIADAQVTLASQPRYDTDANHGKLHNMVHCWNLGLLIMPAPEANDVNGLEFSIHNSEVNSLLSSRPGCHLHGSATAICPRAIPNNYKQQLMVKSFNVP